MFERFTAPARLVIVHAQEEARDLGHDYIGTEHLLLGLLRGDEGAAAAALGDLGVALAPARAGIERMVGRGEGGTPGQMPFTKRAKRVLERSLRESMRMGDRHIGTEHLLLALARETEGVAVGVLSDLGVNARQVHDAVIDVLAARLPTSVPIARPGRFQPGRLAQAAVAEAAALGQGDPTHEHLLLALLRDPEDPAAQLLARLGVTYDAVREELGAAAEALETGRNGRDAGGIRGGGGQNGRC